MSDTVSTVTETQEAKSPELEALSTFKTRHEMEEACYSRRMQIAHLRQQQREVLASIPEMTTKRPRFNKKAQAAWDCKRRGLHDPQLEKANRELMQKLDFARLELSELQTTCQHIYVGLSAIRVMCIVCGRETS